MANNFDVKDAAAASKTIKTTDTAGVHVVHHNVDVIAAGDNNIGNVDIVSLPALVAGSAAIGKLAANSGVDIGDVDVTSLPALPAGNNNIGDVDIASIAAGNNNIGDVDVASIAAGDNNIGNVDVVTLPSTPAGTNMIGAIKLRPDTANGLVGVKFLDVDESEDEVKATPGQLYFYHLTNLHASALRYVKFYNDTAANVIVGTTVPVLTIPIRAGTSANLEFTHGIAFSAAICIAATTGFADNDTGAPGANEIIANIGYL